MKDYIVTVKHPTDFFQGEYLLTVKPTTGRQGMRYVSGAKFGCSRDYVTDSDESAIRFLLVEHACKLVSIKAKK